MAMAADPPDGGVLLFGGYDPTTSADGDTWIFHDGAWAQLSPSTSPPPRWGARMTWDPADGTMILFGGRDGSGNWYSDTWTYTSSGGWSQVPVTGPSARELGEMFYDPSISKVVYQGGTEYTGGAWVDYSDTWEYSGGSWSNVTKTLGSSTSPVSSAFTAWDPTDAYGLVYGGASATTGTVDCPNYGTTWTFSSGWSATSTTGQPPPLTAGQGTWDPIDGYFLLNSGLVYTPANSTNSYCEPLPVSWEYVGGTWTNVTGTLGAFQPPARCCGAMAWDPLGRLAVLYGGTEYSNTTGAGIYVQDSWTYPCPPFAGVALGATSTHITAPQNVSFDATLAGGFGTYSYNWSFGDGSPNDTTSTPTHEFRSSGTYTVELQATDAQGRSANLSRTITVAAGFTGTVDATPPSGDVPLVVNLSVAHSGGTPPFSFDWEFGDGTNASGANVSHTYSAVGTYTVLATVEDAPGEIERYTLPIVVFGPLAGTLTHTSLTGPVPLVENFTVNPTGGRLPYSYAWTFGDGATSTAGPTVSHTYVDPGTYAVQLLLEDSAGRTVTFNLTVDALAPLVLQLVPSPGIAAAPANVSFAVTASGGAGAPAAYDWSFGDGIDEVAGPSLAHTYLAPGNYSVTVNGTDLAGDRATAATIVRVVAHLTLLLEANTSAIRLPGAIAFSAALAGGVAPYAYAWTFGDGGTASTASTTHAFATAGTFPVAVTATDELGETANATMTVAAYFRLALTTATPSIAILAGAALNLSVTVAGGLGSARLVWSGLPAGCTSQNASNLTCIPLETGAFVVHVTATDQAAESAVATIGVTISLPPGTSPPPPSGTSVDLTWVALAAVLGIAAVAIAALVLRRRPPSPTPEPDPTGAEAAPPVADPSPESPPD